MDKNRSNSMMSEGMEYQDGEYRMERHGRYSVRASKRLGRNLLPHSEFCEFPCGPSKSKDPGAGLMNNLLCGQHLQKAF